MKRIYLLWRYHPEDVIDMGTGEQLQLVLNYITLRDLDRAQDIEEAVAFREHGKAVEQLLAMQAKGEL